jgi:hypothetical protein
MVGAQLSDDVCRVPRCSAVLSVADKRLCHSFAKPRARDSASQTASRLASPTASSGWLEEGTERYLRLTIGAVRVPASRDPGTLQDGNRAN